MLSELPLCIFTILGGLAAGIYALSAAFPKVEDEKRPWLIPAVALALLAVSGVALIFHLGHPERLLMAFRQLGAGITQEAIACIAFGVVVAIDLAVVMIKKQAVRPVRIVGAVLGLVLVVVMCLAYFAYFANAALHSWQTIAMLVLCPLASGAAFLTLVCKGGEDRPKLMQVTAVLSALAAVAILLEGVQYMMCGISILPFVLGAVLAVAGATCAWLSVKKEAMSGALIFGLVLLGIAISRCGFYLAF